MKKILSLTLAVCMLFSLSTGLDFSAEAATAKYNNSIINSNIKEIRKYVKNNGFVNGNGDTTVKKVITYSDYTYYNLMLIDSESDELLFYTIIEDNKTEEIISSTWMGIVSASEKQFYIESSCWFTGNSDSDIDGHAFVDKTFNPDKYSAGFVIDYNGTSASNNTAVNYFETQLQLAFDYWDDMLKDCLGLNMGAIGFHNLCKSHKNKTKTTAATTSKDGKKEKACSICGKISSTTVIPKASKVKLDTTSYVYDGSAKKPKVIVKDSKGNKISSDNYTVTYAKGRTEVGKYKVTVKFKGSYTGSKELSFTIKPKATTLSSVKGASKGLSVKWKKQTKQISGYEIQCATDSAFTKGVKTSTVSKNSTTSKNITGLSAKKKYYVRVRAYKTVGKSKVYSDWSAAKSATTK